MQQDAAMTNETHKKHIKDQYDKSVQPCFFKQGYLVLTFYQKHAKLGKGKFESMWYGPYVVSKVLEKWAYKLVPN